MRAAPLSRREALRLGVGAAAGALAAGSLAACSRFGERIEVAVGWSGRELDQFRQVVRRFEREDGRPVDLVSAGDGIDAFLRARHRAGNPPDVAVLSRPGLVEGYRASGWLEPVSREISARYERFWTDLVSGEGEVWGAWLKAAHKTLLWFREPLPRETGGPPGPAPDSWEELRRRVRALACDDRGDGRGPACQRSEPAPLAIGAADWWVVTDWLENLLVARAPETYADLAAGAACWDRREVRAAFGELARVWGVPGAFPGGPGRALLTQFEESVIQVVATGEALMVLEGDFVLPVAEEFRSDDGGLGVVGLRSGPVAPGSAAGNGDGPLLVGGDFAVVMKGSRAGHELVGWLTDGPDPFRSWLRAGGYLSPNITVCGRPDVVANLPSGAPAMAPGTEPGGEAVRRQRCQDLYPSLSSYVLGDFLAGSDRLRFDLSDLLPSAYGGLSGMGRVMQDFFVSVTDHRLDVERQRDLEPVVSEVVRRLNEVAGGGSCAA